METFFGFIVAISVISVFLIVYFGIYILAKKNLFFTIVPEGQIKVVMRSGRAVKYLANIKDHSIELDNGKISDTATDHTGVLNEILGVYWIGVPPFNQIYTYRFRWNKWDMEEEKTMYDLVKKDEDISWLLYRAPYAMKMEGVETKERIPLNLVFVITVSVVNAEKVLFKTSNWLTNVTAAVTSAVRDFVGNCNLKDLVSMKTEISGDDIKGISFEKKENSKFVDVIRSLNGKEVGNIGLIESFGIQIDVVNFQSLEVIDGGTQQKLLEATQAAYIADRESEKIITIATAEANAIKLKGEATAGAIKAKMDALGANSSSVGIIALSDAIATAKPSSLILGTSVMPTTEVKGGGKT